MAKELIISYERGDIVVVAPGAGYQKIHTGDMFRVGSVSPIYKSDWSGHGPLTHYSLTLDDCPYGTVKSTNFRKAEPHEIDAFRRGIKSTNNLAQGNGFMTLAIENNMPCFVQQIEQVANSEGSDIATVRIDDPKYFETGAAAKKYVEDAIVEASHDRKYPQFAIFRYQSTAQAKKPEVEFTTTTF